MNTIHGSKRNGGDSLELIARTSEATITEVMLADYRDQYDYLELQDRDVDGVNEDEEYEILDSWSGEQEDEADEDKPLVYWRRRATQNTFPAESITDVEVVTPEEYADEYGGTPELGTFDGSWHAVTKGEDGIDDELGLCGDLTEIHLLCDAMYISAAIHQRLGLKLAAWDEDCMWTRKELDGHDDEDADYYFRTIGKVYGADAEVAARRQYAKE